MLRTDCSQIAAVSIQTMRLETSVNCGIFATDKKVATLSKYSSSVHILIAV